VNDAELEKLAQRLGARAAERLDVEHTADMVLARLRQEPRRTSGAWFGVPPAWLKIAAAAVIVVSAGLVARQAAHWETSGAAPVEPATTELNDLSAAQLREVLRTVELPGGAQEAVSAQDVGLEDLSAPQLQALLASLEG
jgi:hypothetical protein